MSKISVVIVGRNDDYSGDLDSRSIPSMNSMVQEFDEVVYVDFNSPECSYLNKISDAIPKTGKIKHIIIPPKDAKALDPAVGDRFIEAWARNIGIRRCSNDFIASTNIDIISSRPDMQKISKDVMYTCPRRDVPIEVYKSIPREDLKRALHANVGKFQPKPDVLDSDGNPIWDENDRWSVVVCCGDFQMAHKDVWEGIRGYEERNKEGRPTGRVYFDTNLMKKASLSGYGIAKTMFDLFHLNHNTGEYINHEQTTERNCQIEYVQQFESTSNGEDWGFEGHEFEEEII